MKRQNVTFFIPRIKSLKCLSDNDFTPTPSGKMYWLQKLCFKFLTWAGAKKVAYQETIEKVEFPPEKIEEIILQNQDYLKIRWIEPKYLLIGEDAYSKFTDKRLSTPVVIGDFVLEAYMNRAGKITVIFIPYMDGVVVVPDLEKYKS